jgi:hypothetical protein
MNTAVKLGVLTCTLVGAWTIGKWGYMKIKGG